jgi:hypothetical protein
MGMGRRGCRALGGVREGYVASLLTRLLAGLGSLMRVCLRALSHAAAVVCWSHQRGFECVIQGCLVAAGCWALMCCVRQRFWRGEYLA